MRKKGKYTLKMTYSPFAELLADPVNPLPQAKITYHMTKIYEGLDALDQMLHPEVRHWQAVADAANMLDTLSREMDVVSDTDGAIRDGMEVLALAWNRYEHGLPNTLDHDDLTKLRLIVNSYMEAMETLPERVMVRAHRMTEKRMYKILNGQKQEGDIVI
jgi:hypothetical protein